MSIDNEVFEELGRDARTGGALPCLTDPNPFVRPEAVRVLSSLLGIDAVPTLVTLVDDTNAMVRAAAAVELARLGAAPSDRTPSVATFLHSCEANR